MYLFLRKFRHDFFLPSHDHGVHNAEPKNSELVKEGVKATVVELALHVFLVGGWKLHFRLERKLMEVCNLEGNDVPRCPKKKKMTKVERVTTQPTCKSAKILTPPFMAHAFAFLLVPSTYLIIWPRKTTAATQSKFPSRERQWRSPSSGCQTER